jgi:hypothetical protein
MLSLGLEANKASHLGMPPTFSSLSTDPKNCLDKPSEEDKVKCRADKQAKDILREMKKAYATSSKDSMVMMIKNVCEDKKECIQSTKYSITEDRHKVGKALGKLYQAVLRLILDTSKKVTEGHISTKQADQYLNERVVEMYNSAVDEALNSVKGEAVGSNEKQKNEVSKTKETSEVNKTGLEKRALGTLFRVGKEVSEYVMIGGKKVLAKELAEISVKGLLKYSTRKFCNLAVALLLLPFRSIAVLFQGIKALRHGYKRIVSSIANYAQKRLSSWQYSLLRDLVVSLKWGHILWLGAMFLLSPEFSPIAEVIYGNGTEPAGDTEMKNPCDDYHEEIYDAKSDHRWYFQCSLMSYYRFDAKRNSFVIYTKNTDSDMCKTNTTTLSCQKAA